MAPASRNGSFGLRGGTSGWFNRHRTEAQGLVCGLIAIGIGNHPLVLGNWVFFARPVSLGERFVSMALGSKLSLASVFTKSSKSFYLVVHR